MTLQLVGHQKAGCSSASDDDVDMSFGVYWCIETPSAVCCVVLHLELGSARFDRTKLGQGMNVWAEDLDVFILYTRQESRRVANLDQGTVGLLIEIARRDAGMILLCNETACMLEECRKTLH